MSAEGPSAPRYVGAYEVLGRVATSATGSVWRGRDHALGRDVALKQVAGGAVRSVEQLRAEARVLARLSHPNIVGVIDLIEAPDGVWLVEEWVDGLTLSDVLQRAGRFSAIQAVGAVRGGLLGLDFAHRNQVVHGDVSPSNLLLDLGGTTRLVDFGLAQPAGATGVTGTPGYLSPEAAWGMPVLPASDVYSAAAVLALLLRGRPLFGGTTAQDVLAAQFRPGVADLRGVGGPLGTVLQAALAPNPAERPANAGQFLGLLDEAAVHTFGAGWLGGASVVGLVSAAATAGVTTAMTPPASLVQGQSFVQGAPAVQGQPIVQGQPVAYQPAHPGPLSPGPGHGLGRPVRRILRSRRLLASVGGGVAVAATVAAVAVALHHGSPARPLAAPPSRVAASSRPAVVPASFDLHTVDWDSVTVPGRACFASHDITLHNGKATLPIPAATPPGGYLITRSIEPQYGQLGNGGPKVAVLGLMCAGTGGNSGTGTFWPSVAVFDAPAGHVRALGLYIEGDLGTVGPSGSWLAARQTRVQDGVIIVSGDYAKPQDAHCCPSGRGTVTISYRNGKLVVGRIIPTGTALGAPTPSPATTSPATTSPPTTSPGGVGRTITFTPSPGHTYVATVRAQDTITDCAANSYGSPVINFFRQHPCLSGGRRLVTLPFKGRTLALSVIGVGVPAGPPGDLYRYAGELVSLERAPGTGGLDDLLRSGVRPAGWPAAIPANEAFVVAAEDNGIEIFDAWYLDGPTVDQDPALVQLAQSLFLTPIALG